MDIQSFLQIGIVGIALATLIQVIKVQYGTESLMTKGLTILLALGCGALYFFFNGTPIWAAFVGILAAASTFYAFFLK